MLFCAEHEPHLVFDGRMVTEVYEKPKACASSLTLFGSVALASARMVSMSAVGVAPWLFSSACLARSLLRNRLMVSFTKDSRAPLNTVTRRPST